jgi:hypothetical protein
MELGEIVFKGATAVRSQCGSQYLGSHERIAVAITADPAAQAQERGEVMLKRDVGTRKLVFEVGVEPWQFGRNTCS